MKNVHPTDSSDSSIQYPTCTNYFRHSKRFSKYFSVEFLKDSSTKLMCIVLANPLNVDNKTFLRVKKCHNPIIDTVY